MTLAFGTDYPVESIDPFRGLYSAVTRKNEAGTKSFEPGEAIPLNEAIYAYTQASAFAEFREGMKGRLEPGMVADLIVLDRDITKVPARELLATKVLRTVVDGETVYQVESAATSEVPASEGTPSVPENGLLTGVDATKPAPEQKPTKDADDGARSGTSHPPE